MRRIEDAGERIAGARNDFSRRNLAGDDILAMTSEEASDLVRRDNVWPMPDWAELVASGMPVATAAAVRLVRSRLAPSPTVPARADPLAWRLEYAAVVALVRDTCSRKPFAATPQELVLGLAKAFDESGVRRNRIWVAAKGKTHPFEMHAEDAARLAMEIEEGFPVDMPVWRKGVRVVPDPRKEGRTFVAVRRGEILQEGATEAECLELLEKVHSESKRKRKPAVDASDAAAPLPAVPKTRPHLDVLERTGLPDHRQGRNVSSQDFVDVLGFRGIQFGNWVPQDERQRLLDLGWDAVHDLAGVMGIEPRAVSLGGTLAIALGARGKGGAPAHYEPGQRIFNMGRMSGAGNVAHEWGHALDHWAGTVGWTGSSAEIRGATGYRVRVADIAAQLSNLGSGEAKAFATLVGALHEGLPALPAYLEEKKASLEKLEASRAAGEANGVKYEAGIAAGRNRNVAFERKLAVWMASNAKRIEATKASIESAEATGLVPETGVVKTDFLANAIRIGGGASTYWTRPTELFARSFESWVHDRIGQAGGRSDYLVHGVEDGRLSGPEWKGDPYPSGEERIRFGRLFDDLAVELADRLGRNERPAPSPI
jgi:hypothetical protein